jgi:hypothetical protein
MADHVNTSEPAKPREPITDSPWLWFALFTGCALAALLATGGRFGKKQARLENQYEARAALASGQMQIEDKGTGERVASGRIPHFSTENDTVIPLWPLEIILGLMFTASFALLLRERMREAPAAESAPPAAVQG